MPNNIIFNNCINNIESTLGITVDRQEWKELFEEGWKNDLSDNKQVFYKNYKNLFSKTLNQAVKKAVEENYLSKSDKVIDFGEKLSCLDSNIKTCAMAFISEIREDKKNLSAISFGGKNVNDLSAEITSVTHEYSTHKKAEQAVESRREIAYNKYEKDWALKPVRNITSVAFDDKKLSDLSQEEKIDYVLALMIYKDQMSGKKVTLNSKEIVGHKRLGEHEEGLVNSAIDQLFKDLKWDKTASLTDNLAPLYYEQGAKINDKGRINEQVSKPVNNYRKSLDLAEKEINDFNKLLIDTTAFKKEQESKPKKEFSAKEEEEMALAVGDMFAVIDSENELKNDKKIEPEYLNQKISSFNAVYNLRVNPQKLRSSVEQLARLTMIAKSQKENFLDPDTVVVIKNGKERFFNKKSYLKDERNKDKKFEGGFVIERKDKTVRRYDAKEYYKTHLTQKESYVVQEIKKTYGQMFAEACSKAKIRNYASGRPTDFAQIAKNVDDLFKTVLYDAGIYKNDNRKEVADKFSFGGFTAEELTQIATKVNGGDWELDQKSEKAWNLQNEGSKRILNNWLKKEAGDFFVRSSVNRVQKSLSVYKKEFENGIIDKKRLLEYTIAGEAHLNKKFNTGGKKVFSFIQYRKEKNAINECRKVLGLTEKQPLRAELTKVYEQANLKMSKDNVLQSMQKVMSESLDFKKTKERLDKEHEFVRDRAQKQRQEDLDKLIASGREPLNIEALNEKNAIVNAQPRGEKVKQQSVVKNKELQHK